MKIWSDVEYVYRCLADVERTDAFERSIEATVRPGDTVLDLGSGSGIMALLAARAGAARVFAVEVGPYLSRVSRQVFDESGYGAKIESLRIDARKLDLAKVPKPDVVTCEMITTGLIGEMQGPVLSSLRQAGLIDHQTRLIPAALTTSIALVNADFTFYGFDLRFPLFIDYFSRSFEQRVDLLSEAKELHSVNFLDDFDEHIAARCLLVANTTGSVDGLLLTSTTLFPDGSGVGTCVSYCQPVVLPVRPAIPVKKGDVMGVKVHYRMGGGFDSLRYEAKLTLPVNG